MTVLDSSDSNPTLDAFDVQVFEETASLLKDDLQIAIEEYLEDAENYINDIEKGANNNDMERIAKASHPLKSNSRVFGLLSVATLAESINIKSDQALKNDRAESAGSMPGLATTLKDAFFIAEERLKKELKRFNQ